MSLEELEGRRRRDVEETRMKQDLKRAKIAENHDVPGAVAKTLEVNDPGMGRRRGRLMLPAPQVSSLRRRICEEGKECILVPGTDVMVHGTYRWAHDAKY